MKFEPPELLRYFGEKRNEKGQRWRMDSEVYIWMTRTIAMQALPSWQVDRREQVDSSGVFETLIVFAISSQAESLSVGQETSRNDRGGMRDKELCIVRKYLKLNAAVDLSVAPLDDSRGARPGLVRTLGCDEGGGGNA
ncbi:hypothetical protein C8J57DRAFT_1245761 [Mycena rebaudengoi]|nr:hypothetical protein C8J57DRAFT_1245761 [Mycena rebaudengoi]